MTLRRHAAAVTCLAAVGRLLVSGSMDTSVRVYEPSQRWQCVAIGKAHKGDVLSLTVVRTFNDEAVFASSSGDNTVKLWHVSFGGYAATRRVFG